MAVTRREFVTTLGLLAGAMGMGQSELAKVVEAFGGPGSPAMAAGAGVWGKPKVVWVHGAECTGCSTSLLSLFEDAAGVAVPGHPALGDITAAQALAVATKAPANTTAAPFGVGAAAGGYDTVGHSVNWLGTKGFRTLDTLGLNVDAVNAAGHRAVNIADVLVDFIDLQYHETVMAMGGDGAYAFLKDQMAGSDQAFVLVVEGAVQNKDLGGYWNKKGDTPWCSIAADGRPEGTLGLGKELSFDDVVEQLAIQANCKAVIAIGQCATFGGYPACVGPDLVPLANGGTTRAQTGAQGVYDFLVSKGYVTGNTGPGGAASEKVVNVPGCPTNPWWFVLTVVAWLVDAATATATSKGVLGILDGDLNIVGGVDSQRRLLAVYGNLLHGKYCPRYPKYAARIFASKPGDDGCLKNIGCKGLSTMSLCGRHGWNAQQPENAKNAAGGLGTPAEGVLYKSTDGVTPIGGFCMTAGAPCMGCTEKGYPDAFTPFVIR